MIEQNELLAWGYCNEVSLSMQLHPNKPFLLLAISHPVLGFCSAFVL